MRRFKHHDAREALQLPIAAPVTGRRSFWAKRPLFHANFYLVGDLVRNEEEEFWISCRSVAAADAVTARTYIEAIALPAFIKWARELEVLPANSTRRERSRIEMDWVASGS